MSYLVLARKWRPQTFEEVVGQEHVTQTLKNAIAQGRVAHAFLFSGPRGVGKTSVARILAKALNCASGPTAHPCNQCQSCQEITQGHSLDVLEIDGASNRGIDEVRELRENIRYLPAHGRYKVYIIDEVHMLTKEAFNALLKTLEEPPSHVLFVMATTEPHKVPVTILSRCQRYDFKRLPAPLIQEHLARLTAQEGWQLAPEGLRLLATEAEGSLRDALGLLDQVVTFGGRQVSAAEVARILGLTDRRVLLQTLTTIIQRRGAEVLQLVEELHEHGLDLKRFYQDLVLYSRHLLLAALVPEARSLVEVADPEWQQLQGLAQQRPLPYLFNLLNELLKASEDLRRASFPRLALEILLLRLVHLEPVVPIEEWLERLAALEARLASGEASPEAAVSSPVADQPKVPELSESKPPAQRWPEFVVLVQKQMGNSVAAALQQSRLEKEEEQHLVITLGQGWNALGEQHLTGLRELAEDFFGSQYQLSIRPSLSPPAAPPPAASPKPATMAEIKQQVLEIFGGQWVTEDRQQSAKKEESP
ncbi:MAG: DNA polymerase III subunit gamma/tau [Deltaproteobacteria bacterium]|nr:DNA polymerase III subunit gamma/tau [Deltaproteobacteria bacterium]MBW1951711.1 DNA polymerase III subunit gamma/tau [Deltaproteobacteria bacterium]MBW1987582.1 DNA polymerase III subunit gamma/tau [Deltaproteobacteria bacterium]MBW2134724.1 DNA polymerase III subunit gamma/tau [Deltaproteobacteria bacterium]